jgi:hypothetical protein
MTRFDQHPAGGHVHHRQPHAPTNPSGLDAMFWHRLSPPRAAALDDQ